MAILGRARAALVLSFVVSGTILAAGAAAGRERGPALPAGAADVTDTARGKQLIREAKERFAQRGYEARDMRAVKDPTGYLIVPRATRFDTYDVTLADGRRVTALAPITADDPVWVQSESAAGDLIAASASPSWQFVGSYCFTKVDSPWAVLDHCYIKYKLASDGSGSYDWFALRRFGTASSNSPWVVDLARIRAYRYSGSPQSWADWSPRGNWSGGSCSTATIGISSPIGGLSQSFERCPDQVTFTKSSSTSQPDYKQTWFGLGTRGNRELHFEIAVRVKQGGSATWTLPAEVRGSAY